MPRLLVLLCAALVLTACGKEESSQSTPAAPAAELAPLELVGMPDDVPAFIGNEVLGAQDGSQVISISVEGMHCAFNCAPKVHDTLAGVEGVQEARVSMDNKTAWIRVPEGSTLTAEQLAKEINDNTGFEAAPQAG